VTSSEKVKLRRQIKLPEKFNNISFFFRKNASQQYKEKMERFLATLIFAAPKMGNVPFPKFPLN
jgi:hypothetical protein